MLKLINVHLWKVIETTKPSSRQQEDPGKILLIQPKSNQVKSFDKTNINAPLPVLMSLYLTLKLIWHSAEWKPFWVSPPSSIQLHWNLWSSFCVNLLINQQTDKQTRVRTWTLCAGGFLGGQSFVSLIIACLLVNNVILARCKIGKQATVASRCYLPTVPLFPPFVCLSLCGVCTTHPPRKQAPLSGQQNTWVLQFTVRLLLLPGKRGKKKKTGGGGLWV